MPAQTRVGDVNTGHDNCPPVALAAGSPNVFINGKAAGRLSDAYEMHSCPVHPAHAGHIATGSSTVRINGMAAARIGDTVSCGGSGAQGSSNVFVGG